MSGDQVAPATGGRSSDGFIPRLRTRTLAALPTQPVVKTKPQHVNLQSVNGHAVRLAAGLPSLSQPTPPLSSLVPSSPVPAATKSTSPPVSKQSTSWKTLPEKQLWEYYVKVRQLYLAAPLALRRDKSLPLTKRYLSIREFLFALNYPDVLRVAANYKFKRMPQSSLSDPEDLQQAASMAMLLLLDKYDPGFGDGQVTFMGYACATYKSRIEGAIIDVLRELMEFPRTIPPKRRKYRVRSRRLQDDLGYCPTKEEILDHIGWEHLKDFSDPLLDAGVFNQSQISAFAQDDSEDWESDAIQLSEARPIVVERRLVNCENTEKLLAPFTDPEMRHIFFSYYFTNANFRKIARELRKAFGKKRSQSWVHLKHDEGKAILKRHFTREELTALIQVH